MIGSRYLKTILNAVMHGSNTIMDKKILEMNRESSYKKRFCTGFLTYSILRIKSAVLLSIQ